MVFSLVLLVDGNLASGSYDKTIRIWDTATGITLKELEGMKNFIEQFKLI
jgi:WD40 repeat protein